MVKASQRKKLALEAVTQGKMKPSQTCRTFCISATCCRYKPMLSDENKLIAESLIELTEQKRNWGFGLCFLYLRNVKGHPCNHKRVYRIYRELSLNLRIKPHKRLKREKPSPLTVPQNIVIMDLNLLVVN